MSFASGIYAGVVVASLIWLGAIYLVFYRR
jgi:hypothetical protein